MLDLLASNPIGFLILITGLVISVTVHEFAHAFTADKLGDPTPRSQGRVTLNPLAHLDPLGSVVLLLTGFGWGKPVIFDPYNLRDLRRDIFLIAAAGPASNLVLATLVAVLLPILPFPPVVWGFLIGINVTLAAFNLLPIHPLDGGKIFSSLLPRDLAYEYDSILHRYGFLILLLLVFPIFGARSGVSYFITPLTDLLMNGILNFASAIHTLFLSSFF
jgi:Zn-dependent protease